MASPPLKNIFRFRSAHIIMTIKNKLLTSWMERRKTFDSPLANHLSQVMQSFLIGSIPEIDLRLVFVRGRGKR
jgi:hypothetical protein